MFGANSGASSSLFIALLALWFVIQPSNPASLPGHEGAAARAAVAVFNYHTRGRPLLSLMSGLSRHNEQVLSGAQWQGVSLDSQIADMRFQVITH